MNRVAPRSIEAASAFSPSRRSRAITLLNTTTMQNVACATTMVRNPRSSPSMAVKAELSASPVTMPGSAIGRITSSETASRPKNA